MHLGYGRGQKGRKRPQGGEDNHAFALQSLAIAQQLEGPIMQRYQQLARSTGLWLSLGGFQEKGPDPQHNYNCHVIVNDKGELVAKYRKVRGSWRRSGGGHAVGKRIREACRAGREHLGGHVDEPLASGY